MWPGSGIFKARQLVDDRIQESNVAGIAFASLWFSYMDQISVDNCVNGSSLS